MIVELAGLGAVGRRLLSELLSTPAVELVRVRSRRPEVAAAQVGGADRVEVVGPEVPVAADWVAVATEVGGQRTALRRAAAAGVPAVSVCDDPALVEELLGGSGPPVVVGATFSPGLTDVMAVHAASLLDEVTELHVARHGAGGSACVEARSRAVRREGRVWREGAWEQRPAGSGRELWFFPSPVDGRDTYRADLAEVLTLRAVHPKVDRLSARISMTRWERMPAMFGAPSIPKRSKPAGMGGALVEARGRRGAGTETVVLGVVDRLEGAVAALVAVCGERLMSREGRTLGGGVTAGELGSSVAMLDSLGRRVTIARFGEPDVT
ncbi:MAG: hypothetical protein R2704_12465 [Microthrixaceae bacterium]